MLSRDEQPQGRSAQAPTDAGTQRFAFGANWRRFLRVVNQQRIEQAEASLTELLGETRLDGQRLLDMGSGSGLFSLVARRLGAEVWSVDNDSEAVACAQQLRQAHCRDDKHWHILRGSVLDVDLVARLGTFDIVYCWGVLHHTGQMWQGLDNLLTAVAADGRLCLAIYNDQGWKSVLWRRLKLTYCHGPLARLAIIGAFVPQFAVSVMLIDLAHRQSPFSTMRDYWRNRGMSMVHDWIDWLGGYPFEVARPEQVLDHMLSKGFMLAKLHTVGGGLGNNEFVFRRMGARPTVG